MLTKAFCCMSFRKHVYDDMLKQTSSRSTLSLARARRGRISITAGEGSEANETCGGKNAQTNVLEEGEQQQDLSLHSSLSSRIFCASSFAYLCIFAPHFSAIFKEPNLRFESAHLTSSKRLFDELIKAL